MNAERRGFAQGVCWSAAFMARDHNEQSFAEGIMRESGYSYDDFVKAQCAEYDLITIRELQGKEGESDE